MGLVKEELVDIIRDLKQLEEGVKEDWVGYLHDIIERLKWIVKVVENEDSR